MIGGGRVQSECPVSGLGLGLRAVLFFLASYLQDFSKQVNPVLLDPQDKVTAMWGGVGSLQCRAFGLLEHWCLNPRASFSSAHGQR